MKSRLAHFLIGLLLLAGCSKKGDDPTPADPAGSGRPSTLSANVTGFAPIAYSTATTVSSVPVIATRLSTSDPNYGPYMLRIEGSENGRGVILTLAKFTGAGTYVLKSDYNGTLLVNNTGTYSDGTSTYRSRYMPGTGVAQGQVVVTSYDETTQRVKGTFSFSGSDVNPQNLPASHVRQLTDGAFDSYVTL